MEKTVQDRVLAALNELNSGSLKSFRNKLSDREFTVKDGYNKIPQGKLENKDPEDLTKLILQYYGDSYGVELTVSVLKAIDENQVAADLEQRLDNVKERKSKNPNEESPSTSEVKERKKPNEDPPSDPFGFLYSALRMNMNSL
ncbi:apoptosis-associated speck-like protein containing a CARD isoform X3 [Rana temporaria]|uniref:apoptosis-associated speck-like protein containing a CARD isoform X3 n=1 Tax=Rana temporaria TaxID=8407 RepID=UPI001AAD1B9E|nr:apoptosis-associated speck-like protein containing a CARD isoform X3 [Rana temporaria]